MLLTFGLQGHKIDIVITYWSLVRRSDIYGRIWCSDCVGPAVCLVAVCGILRQCGLVVIYRKPGKCGLVAVYSVPQAGKTRLGGGEYTKPEICGLVPVYGIPRQCGWAAKYTKPEKCGLVAVYRIPQAGKTRLGEDLAPFIESLALPQMVTCRVGTLQDAQVLLSRQRSAARTAASSSSLGGTTVDWLIGMLYLQLTRG